jgi:hypothetical protein
MRSGQTSFRYEVTLEQIQKEAPTMNYIVKSSLVAMVSCALAVPVRASWLSDFTGINIDIPAGRVSVGTPDPAGALRRLPQVVQNLPQDFANLANPAGSFLAFAVRQAKAQASYGAQPIPPNIMATLQPYFPADVLQSVRYNTFDNARITLDSAVMLINVDVVAITLEDIVVFRSAYDAQNNVGVWAHELTHVLQYRSRGVETFANTYTTNAWVLENEAQNNANRIVGLINAQAMNGWQQQQNGLQQQQQQFMYFNVTGQLLAADGQGNLYPAIQNGQIIGPANGRLYVQNGQYIAVDSLGGSYYATRLQ